MRRYVAVSPGDAMRRHQGKKASPRSLKASPGDTFRLNVEAEIDDVAFLHDILFTLETRQAFFFGAGA